MIPVKKVEELVLRHKSLESELSSGSIDKKLFATKSKEYSDINEIIIHAKKYIEFENFEMLCLFHQFYFRQISNSSLSKTLDKSLNLQMLVKLKNYIM